MLSRCQTERSRKAFWNAEQSDRHLASREGTRIASQPLLPRESSVAPAAHGKGAKVRHSGGRAAPRPHFEALAAQELHTRASMLPTAPVLPEQGSRTDEERVQQHAHSTGLGGSPPMPLTLFAQGPGETTADVGV